MVYLCSRHNSINFSIFTQKTPHFDDTDTFLCIATLLEMRQIKHVFADVQFLNEIVLIYTKEEKLVQAFLDEFWMTVLCDDCSR